jgi:hypothetical protein
MEENLNKVIYSIPGFTISSYLFLGSILQFTVCRLYDDITIKSFIYIYIFKQIKRIIINSRLLEIEKK